MSKLNPYERITERILSIIETKNELPWIAGNNCKPARPGKNASGKMYQGINALMTYIQALDKEYSSHLWLTYNQAKKMGGNVRKGETGTPVVYFGRGQKKNDAGQATTQVEGEKEFFSFAKGYTVFNLDQIDGISPEDFDFKAVDTSIRYANEPLEACEQLVGTYLTAQGIELEHKPTTAHYLPHNDTINIPAMDRYTSAEQYYKTLFHEMIHSTGAEKRLNRDLSGQFRSKKYGVEELTAEFGAAFLTSHTGITTKIEENSAAYIKSWTNAIKANPSMITKAAAAAGKAANFITEA